MNDPAAEPIYRAPMQARAVDELPDGAGAEHGLQHELVGLGEQLDVVPGSLDEAVTALADRYGEKAGRMVRRFAELPDGTLLWTRDRDGRFRVGRITGPWRYDDSTAAAAVGLHHVRDARWLARGFTEAELPTAVAETFRRGGRNFQRIHDDDAERETAELWAEYGDGG